MLDLNFEVVNFLVQIIFRFSCYFLSSLRISWKIVYKFYKFNLFSTYSPIWEVESPIWEVESPIWEVESPIWEVESPKNEPN